MFFDERMEKRERVDDRGQVVVPWRDGCCGAVEYGRVSMGLISGGNMLIR